MSNQPEEDEDGQKALAWRNFCQDLLKEISKVFIDAPAEKLQSRLSDIINKNYQLSLGSSDHEASSLGFKADRKTYFHKGVHFKTAHQVKPLHPSLFPDFQIYTAIDHQQSQRAVRLQQVLWPAMLSSRNLEELRNVIPEALVQRCDHSIKSVPRTAPEGLPEHTLWIKKKEYSQFQSIVEDFVASEFLD